LIEALFQRYNNRNLVLMANKKKSKAPSTKKIKFPNDEPVHLNMTFEEAIKLAAKTPIKKKKKK